MRRSGLLQYLLSAACLFAACDAHSFTWQDLWVSPDKQAEALMKEGQFVKAEELFQQEPWKAAASYRAKNYKQAARQFGALQSESGYYNQGNALAQMGQYQDALKAYDKALAMNPGNQDAIYNRKLVEDLLKKNQNKQQNQSDNKQQDNKQQDNKNNQNQQDKSSGQSGQDKKDQQKNGNKQQNENNQGKPQDKQQQDNKEEPGKDNKQESGKDSKDKQDKEQQDKDSKAGENPVPAKNDKAEKADKGQPTAAQTQEEREKQQAKEQWLKLIPDDPGGLMREKFLRDYIRRQRGWQQ